MYRQTESQANNKAGGDENASNLAPGKASFSAVLGPRRNVLADVSNAVNPSIVQKTTLLPKRNLRPTTIQSSLAAKNKIVGGISSSGSASELQSLKPTDLDKENEEPFVDEHAGLPQVNRSYARAEYEYDDLDTEDLDDPATCAEYAPEIMNYMLKIETKIMPGPGFASLQKELNWHMRAVLVDWLIEVQYKSKMFPETLFLSINIIDRFLAKRCVSLAKLQLVGLAGTMLASKYEEIISPAVSNFVFFADNAYDSNELLRAERYMLHVINFNLAFPSPLTYLRRISKADNYDTRHRCLAKYLMELTLLDHRFIICPPSLVAAVAMYLSRIMLRGGPWDNNFIHYSGGYSEEDLKPWADILIDFLKGEANKYDALYKKYGSKKLLKASFFVQEYMKKYYGVSRPIHVAATAVTTATTAPATN